MAEKEGLEVASRPLFRCPKKSAGYRFSLIFSTATPTPCSLYPPPAAVAGVARAFGARVQVHLSVNKKKHPVWGAFSYGGEGGTRTLAPVSRPIPLAGVPRHQLEYFSVFHKAVAVINHFCVCDFEKRDGGEEGIRTLGSDESLVFKTSSLNRSDTSPNK